MNGPTSVLTWWVREEMEEEEEEEEGEGDGGSSWLPTLAAAAAVGGSGSAMTMATDDASPISRHCHVRSSYTHTHICAHAHTLRH